MSILKLISTPLGRILFTKILSSLRSYLFYKEPKFFRTGTGSKSEDSHFYYCSLIKTELIYLS